MPLISAEKWDQFISRSSHVHFLQTSAWGRLKSTIGWQPYYVQAGQAGAQVLLRRMPFGLHIAYIPKGPMGIDWELLWADIDELCRQKNAIFLKIEPDIKEPADPEMLAQLNKLGRASSTIQPRRTLVIDLAGTEDDWLGRMKQKTRYNIGLAQRKAVVIRPSGDVDTFYQMMRLTGYRDGFGIHLREYYQKAYQLFAPDQRCALFQAEYEGKPLAAIMVFLSGDRAWYLYGASSDEERNRMPTYLLQWEGMRWSSRQGCTQYDLWGVPDASEEELETGFTNRSDGLWGVYRFKRGFGARLVRSIGAWDRIYNRALYWLYQIYIKTRSSEIN